MSPFPSRRSRQSHRRRLAADQARWMVRRVQSGRLMLRKWAIELLFVIGLASIIVLMLLYIVTHPISWGRGT